MSFELKARHHRGPLRGQVDLEVTVWNDLGRFGLGRPPAVAVDRMSVNRAIKIRDELNLAIAQAALQNAATVGKELDEAFKPGSRFPDG